MLIKTSVALISVLALALSPVRGAPVDQYITVTIHETPSDPQSDIDFVVIMKLTADRQDGDSVGWEVLSFKIEQWDGGSKSKVWMETAPAVTGDLWWIEHADPNDPQDDEFVEPPEIIGTAGPIEGTNDDLDYDIDGTVYTPPPLPASPPFTNTGSLDAEFWIVGESQAELDMTDEPASIERDNDPPGSG
ncbi:MAG: hypothetical protein O7F76_14185 [Planctomycetota bacterium]|nr:hypothetical protein [Planctomycetota bacterium]